MKIRVLFIVIATLLFSLNNKVKAQEKEVLNFEEYLSLVERKTWVYAAQKYNIGMAEAAIQTASMFPDPQLEMETTNNELQRIWDMYTEHLWLDVRIRRQKKSKNNLAKDQSELSKIQPPGISSEIYARMLV